MIYISSRHVILVKLISVDLLTGQAYHAAILRREVC